MTKTVVQGHAPNLQTILKAAKNGDLALMECTRKSDGKIVAVLCCVGWDAKAEEYVLAPMAEMFEDNPFEQWVPPKNPNPPFVVDGHESEDPESNMAGDGQFPPFRIFDTERQEYLLGEYATRAEAEAIMQGKSNGQG